MMSTEKTPQEQVELFNAIIKRHLDALYDEAEPHATTHSAVGRVLGLTVNKSLGAGFITMHATYGLPAATDWLNTVLQGFSLDAQLRAKLKIKIVVTVVEA